MPAILNRYGTVLRIWKSRADCADPFTILPPRWAGDDWRGRGRTWQGIASGPAPFHPLGFGQHIEAEPGPHLGKRITWHELPPDVQRFARQTFGAMAPPEA